MVFLIGLLTLIMILDCIVLVFLVLIQLPKKDAGAGLAFGAGATDALFGAGSGTVLTKITKYAAGTFFVLSVILSLLQVRLHGRAGDTFRSRVTSAAPPPTATTPAARPDNALSTPGAASAPAQNPPAPSTNVPSIVPPATNAPLSFSNAAPTNLLVPSTNAAEQPK